MITKPMLASDMENSKGDKMSMKDLIYPLGATPKLDGIRCLRVNGENLSRSFLPIPNIYIQKTMDAAKLPDGLDGELTVYNEDGTVMTFNEIQSAVMSEDGEPNFKFEIFDYVKDDLNKAYGNRMVDLCSLATSLPSFCKIITPDIINNAEELLKYEEEAIADGHEGIMTRSLNSPYKCGRATWKSQYLIKVKRFVDSEAVIIGFEEKLRNENEATKDELGHTKRSSAKSGLVPAGTLGTLRVRDLYDGREFGIGTYKGLKKQDLQHIWDNQDQYMGKIVKYQYQLVGTKDNPRIPSFQGFRDPRDMSE